MKISTTVKIKKDYVWIDTTQLNNPIANFMDRIGMGNDDAVAEEYETMVFACDKKGKVEDWEDLDKTNYKTKKGAESGHKKMVKKWKQK